MVPFVGTGVEKFEGSSDVKIVAVDGDSVNLELMVPRSALVKPENVNAMLVARYGVRTSDSTAIPEHDKILP